MKVNKHFFGIFSFLVMFLLVLTPTLGKYTHTKIGEAGRLTFTPVKYKTEDFIVRDDNITTDSNGNSKAEDEPKWGKGYAEGDQGIKNLHNVSFGIENASSEDLLVTFYVKFQIGGITNLGNPNLKCTVTNINTGESLMGNVSFSTSGWWTVTCTGTINPLELKDSNNNTNIDIVEKSFVVYSDAKDGFTSASYQLSIDYSNSALADIIGGLFIDSVYLDVHMIAIPYNSAS